MKGYFAKKILNQKKFLRNLELKTMNSLKREMN